MRHPFRSILAVALAVMVPAFAHAASFNCAKASHPDEIAICRTSTLSDLDVQMATLFGVRMKVPMLMGSRGAAGDEQVQFLAGRAKCGKNVACLGAAYRQRIDVLHQEIDAAMQDYCVKLGICG